jgi:O-antigen/teichoic acid export membrane protein
VERDTRDVVRGALTNFAGVLARSLTVLFYVYLARAYGPVVTGAFVVCQAGLDIVSKLGLLGLDRGVLTVAARHHAAGDEPVLHRTIAQALAIAAAASLALIAALEAVLAPAAGGLFRRPDLVPALRIMAPGILFWSLSAVLIHATRAVRVMKYEIAVKAGAEPAALFAAALLLRPLLPGVEGLAWAFLASTAAGTVAAAALFARRFPLGAVARRLLAAEGRGDLFRFSAPIGVYDLCNLLLQRVDLFLLNRLAPPAQVGVYSMAQNAAFSFKKVRQSFDPILIPVLAAADARGRREDLLRQYRTVTRWILLINLGLLGAAACSARLIMGIFGGEFTAGAAALVVLTVAIMLNTVLGVSELFILIERPVLNLVNTLVALAIAAGAALALIPRFGMVGAAAASLLAYAVMNALRLLLVWRRSGMHPFTRHHGRALLAAAFAGALAAGVRAAFPAPAGTAAAVAATLAFLATYAGGLLLLGLAEEERAAVRRLRSLLPATGGPQS